MRLPILIALSPFLLACPNTPAENTQGTDTSSETTTGSTGSTSETETGSMILCPESLPLTNAEFVGGLVIEAGTCWTVDENLSLSDGIVTIEEGAELRFGSDIAVSIKTGGQLTINGTAEEPVYLGTADPLVTWQGISFDDSQGSANAWSHVLLENAASARWNGAQDSYGALWLEGSTTISLSDVTFKDNVGLAMHAGEGVSMTLDSLVFDNNPGTAWVSMAGAAEFGPETAFKGNEDDRVHVGFGGNTLADDVTWRALVVPYFITDRTFVEAAWTIDPGVVVQMQEESSLTVRKEGSLMAEGTAESPIVFEGGSVGTRGYWKGIANEVGGTVDPLSYGMILDHVRIADTGSSVWTGNPDSVAGVYMEALGSALITNTEVHNSAGYGLWISRQARTQGFANNHIHDNNVPMRLHPDRVGELAGTSMIEGNTDNRIWVGFGNNDVVTSAAIWRDLGTPYYISDRMFVEATLEIEAGTELEVAQDIGMIVKKLGSLTANGTADEHVVFRGANDNPNGFWRGLQFESNIGANRLSYIDVVDAGSDAWTGNPDSKTSLYVVDNATLELVDAKIGPGGGFGAWVSSGAALTCTAADFSGTAGVHKVADDSIVLGCI